MFWRALRALFLVPCFGFFPGAHAQLENAAPDPVRVTVSVNADGTRTTYEFDSPHHRATATTTGKDGKVVGRSATASTTRAVSPPARSTGPTTNSALRLYIGTTTPGSSLRKPSWLQTIPFGPRSFMRTT